MSEIHLNRDACTVAKDHQVTEVLVSRSVFDACPTVRSLLCSPTAVSILRVSARE